MSAYSQSYKSIINGRVIEDDAVRAIYDGNKLIVDLYDNGLQSHKVLNKKDIKSILAKRANSVSLEKRLINDFGLVVKRKSKSIKRRKSRSKSIRNRSKRRR